MKEFFSVRVNNLLLAIPMRHVEEVQLAVSVKETLSTTTNFRGAFNCRGALIPLFDIRKQIGLDATPVSSSQYFLVLSIDDMKFSIVIDELIGIVRVPESELDSQKAILSEYGTPVLIKLNSEAVSICDLNTLITREISKEFHKLMFELCSESDSFKEKKQ